MKMRADSHENVQNSQSKSIYTFIIHNCVNVQAGTRDDRSTCDRNATPRNQ